MENKKIDENPNTGLIVSCPLCEERSLHVIGSTVEQILQCINCGYVSSPKYVGNKKTNEEFKKLQPDMQKWSKEALERIWIPTIMTLPTGLIYPFDDEKSKMKWGYAKMVDIPEKERHEYPVEGQKDKYYEQRYDMEDAKVFDEFIVAMGELKNEVNKTNHSPKQTELKLQKLKKVDDGPKDSSLSK